MGHPKGDPQCKYFHFFTFATSFKYGELRKSSKQSCLVPNSASLEIKYLLPLKDPLFQCVVHSLLQLVSGFLLILTLGQFPPSTHARLFPSCITRQTGGCQASTQAHLLQNMWKVTSESEVLLWRIGNLLHGSLFNTSVIKEQAEA